MGPSRESMNTQNSITQQQLDISRQSEARASEDDALRRKLQDPAIKLNESIISGDKGSAFRAVAPIISDINRGGRQTAESIMENTGPGAARDVALASNTRGVYDSIAKTTAGAYTGAFDKLANIGAGVGSFSLNEVGAAISGGSAASSSNQAVLQAQAQSQQAKLGFFGELAGAAGGAASGGAFGKPCWIAEVIYGVDDPRTHAARAWLVGPFSDTWYGRAVVRFYSRFGERIAAVVRRSQALRVAFKPLFDMAAARGRELH